jgi:hypothetical protein
MTPPFVPSNRTIQPGLGNRERSDRAAGNSQSVSAAVIFSGHAAREGALAMPRNYVIFGDIEGKLDVLLSSVSSCGLSAELLPNGNQPPVDVTT